MVGSKGDAEEKKNNSLEGQSTESSINLSKPAEKYVADNKIDIQSLTNFLSDIDLITIEDIKQVSKKNHKSERFEIEIKKENLESWGQLNKKEGKKPLFLIGGGYGAYQILDIIVTSSEFYLEGYFDDMSKTMQNLADSLDSGAMVALAVGCSRWSGVVVPTDLLIAHHAIATGQYKLKSVDIVRYKGNAPQQMAKWGRYPVRESVLVMERL